MVSSLPDVVVFISYLVILVRSQTYCIWGRFGSNDFINGEYTYAGTYNYGGGSAPYYSRVIGGSCGISGTWYLYYDGSRWGVSDSTGGSYYARCNAQTSSNPSCSGDMNVWSSGWVADPNVDLSASTCPEWNCNGITVTGSTSNQFWCDGTYEEVAGTRNAYKKNGEDWYIFYADWSYTWYCSTALEPTKCPTPIYASSDEKWDLIEPADPPYDPGNTLGNIDCLPFPTDQPTKAPTTKNPTKNPTNPPTTKAPTDAPTTKSPSRDPTNNPTTKQPSGHPTSNPTTKQPSKAPTDDPTTKAPSKSPTDEPTTKAPTKGPTDTPTTKTPSKDPTSSPVTSIPTKAPSKAATDDPTSSPSTDPSKSPTDEPSKSPSKEPTTSPSMDPSSSPTKNPTREPSKTPSDFPSTSPSNEPSTSPTNEPSQSPSKNPIPAPTDTPTTSPTKEPSSSPTGKPTQAPITPGSPTVSPTSGTSDPTKSPSSDPSESPSKSPTEMPSQSPSKSPTDEPSQSPSYEPSVSPSTEPTTSPSDEPSQSPSKNPTNEPSESPTDDPTSVPTSEPSPVPTDEPTARPSDSPHTPGSPSFAPTQTTPDPTDGPSEDPTQSPSRSPTDDPSSSPSETPSSDPSRSPTAGPQNDPTSSPITAQPTMMPTTTTESTTTEFIVDTDEPTTSPVDTDIPTSSPIDTDSPTISPISDVTNEPTLSPTQLWSLCGDIECAYICQITFTIEWESNVEIIAVINVIIGTIRTQLNAHILIANMYISYEYSVTTNAGTETEVIVTAMVATDDRKDVDALFEDIDESDDMADNVEIDLSNTIKNANQGSSFEIDDIEGAIILIKPATTTTLDIDEEPATNNEGGLTDFNTYGMMEWIIFIGIIVLLLFVLACCYWGVKKWRISRLDTGLTKSTGEQRTSLYEIPKSLSNQNSTNQTTLAYNNSTVDEQTGEERHVAPAFAASANRNAWNSAFNAAAQGQAIQAIASEESSDEEMDGIPRTFNAENFNANNRDYADSMQYADHQRVDSQGTNLTVPSHGTATLPKFDNVDEDEEESVVDEELEEVEMAEY